MRGGSRTVVGLVASFLVFLMACGEGPSSRESRLQDTTSEASRLRSASGAVPAGRYEELVLADFGELHDALTGHLKAHGDFPRDDLVGSLSPHMETVPLRDPLGIAYRYAPKDPIEYTFSPGEPSPTYTLRAAGPDREFDTEDDIVYSLGSRFDL